MKEEDNEESLAEFVASLKESDGIKSEDAVSLSKMVSGETPVDIPEKFRNRVDSKSDSKNSQSQNSAESEENVDIRALIADMSVPEKLKLAMFGNSVCRSLLVQDANRMVQNAVLKNPQLQEGEIEVFSKNPNVAEFVLRTIGRNRTWMKNYSVKVNLVCNPKTPTDLSLKWIRFLNKADLRRISKSKNIPQIVAVNARKRLAESEKH